MLVIVFAFSAMATVSAQSIDEGTNQVPISIAPYTAYTKSTSTNLTVSSGQASASAKFTGYPGTTTKVSITMTLQKQGFLGLYWSDVASWTQTLNSYNATMGKSYGGLSGGTYRVKAVYTAYSGSASETFTEYSGNVKY